jgi:hypothetical protein
MSQPKTPRGKLYMAITAFAISQTIFVFKLIAEEDVIIDLVITTSFSGVMFFLVSLGLNWARWALIAFLTFFVVLFIVATILTDDYLWILSAVGYLAAIALVSQAKQLPGTADGVQENPEPIALNTGSFTNNGVVYDYPQLVTRIKALFIDGMIILTIMVVVMVLMDNSEYRPAVMITLGNVGILLYEPLLTVHSGTIGQRVMNIRVRSFQDPSKKIKITQAYGRVLAKSLLGWISFITINFNAQHRAIHDFVGGSVMVNSPR